jgi:hypothetical protein
MPSFDSTDLHWSEHAPTTASNKHTSGVIGNNVCGDGLLNLAPPTTLTTEGLGPVQSQSQAKGNIAHSSYRRARC